MKFAQVSVSTAVGPEASGLRRDIITTIVGVTVEGEIYETSRVDDDPWTEWEKVSPDIDKEERS